MKKKYIKPNLRVINSMMQKVLTASYQSLSASFQADPGFSNNSNGSRRASWLDDDEEDDDDLYEDD